MEHNRELAASLAQAVEAEPKECFKNSVLALYHWAESHPVENVFYVEGILAIWDGNMLIDHGWLEVAGAIVDVTLDDQDAATYTPVMRYSMAQVKAFVRRRRSFPYHAHSQEARRLMSETSHALYYVQAGDGYEQ